MRVNVLTGAALDAALDDVARLRLTVFRDWPYLYDGDMAYERDYMQSYRDSDAAVVVGAYDGDTLVGASTGAPLLDHAADFAEAFAGSGEDLGRIYYCAESVLLPQYRGRGIGHQFFDLREQHARRLGYEKSAFCGVVRPGDHPARPQDYHPLDPFWRRRGYHPLAGVVARFQWKDLGQSEQTSKPLQFWIRQLN